MRRLLTYLLEFPNSALLTWLHDLSFGSESNAHHVLRFLNGFVVNSAIFLLSFPGEYSHVHVFRTDAWGQRLYSQLFSYQLAPCSTSCKLIASSTRRSTKAPLRKWTIKIRCFKSRKPSYLKCTQRPTGFPRIYCSNRPKSREGAYYVRR